MAYIDTKHIGQCETCRHYDENLKMCKGGMFFCDSGESYSPNMFKIPTADVEEVVRKAVKGYEGYYEVDQFGRVYSVDRVVSVNDNGRQ